MKALLRIEKAFELTILNILIVYIQNIISSYLNTLSYESITGIMYSIYLKKGLFMRLLSSLFLLLFSKRSTVFIKYAIVVKENEILKRRLEQNGIKVKFNDSDRRFFSFILYLYPKAKKLLSIVKPSTVLYKWNCHRKKRWLFPPKQKPKPGRPPISMRIRKLIIEIKKLNPFWGIRRISGELQKLDIDISKDTVRRTIQKGRKDGDCAFRLMEKVY